MQSIINESVGKKFGQLTVLAYLGKKRVRYQCDCGSIKESNFYHVKKGGGCGCRRNLPEQCEKSRERMLQMQRNGIVNSGGDYKSDEFTPFRYIWKSISNNTRKPIENLTMKDLQNVWDNQNGICVYSGIELILPTHTNINQYKDYEYASLDRIDSSKNYEIGNIQFVSRTVNFAKNSMSHEHFKEFIDLIVKNYYSL